MGLPGVAISKPLDQSAAGGVCAPGPRSVTVHGRPRPLVCGLSEGGLQPEGTRNDLIELSQRAPAIFQILIAEGSGTNLDDEIHAQSVLPPRTRYY
jgi:hypothetical protein